MGKNNFKATVVLLVLAWIVSVGLIYIIEDRFFQNESVKDAKAIEVIEKEIAADIAPLRASIGRLKNHYHKRSTAKVVYEN